MKVKDIIIRALAFIGRDDLAKALQGGETLSDEGAETVETLTYCFNAVEDELARYYFTLTTSETLFSLTRTFNYTTFSARPVKILSVKADGKDVAYTLYPQYMEAEATRVTVEYMYSPDKKTIDGDSAFDGTVVCEKLVAAGAAAEFCLINGEIKAAELWESKYRQEIDRARQKLCSPVRIPPRRWV